MAVYDDEKTKSENISDNRLRDITGISPSEEQSMDARARADQNSGAKSETPESLKRAEENGSSSSGDAASSEERGLVKKDVSKPESNFKYSEKKSRLSRFRSFSKRKKIALLVGAGGGLGLLALLIMFLVLIGSFKAVHFSTVLRSVGFARFNLYMRQQFAQTTFDAAVLTDTSSGRLELGDRSLYQKLRRINPEKQLQVLGSEGTLKFEFDGESKWGGAKTVNNFKGVEVNGRQVSLDTVAERFGYKSYNDIPFTDVRQRLGVKAEFVNAIKNGLAERLALEGRSFRSSVYNGLRQATGIRMWTWSNKAREYAGLSAEEARNKNFERAQAEIDKGGTKAESDLDKVQEGADEVAEDAEEAVKQGKPPKKVSPRLASINSTAQDVSSAVFVATVACIVRDLDNSFKESAKPREEQVARFGHDTLTTADQIKTGDTQPQAVGAENDLWSNAQNSLIYKRTAGLPISNADKKQAAELATVTPPGSTFADVIGPINTVIETAISPVLAGVEALGIPLVSDLVGDAKDEALNLGCNAILDEYVQYGIAGGEILLALVTAGSTEVGAQAIIQGLKAGAKSAVKFGGTVGAGELMGQLIESSIDSYSGTDFSATSVSEKRYNDSAVATEYLQQTATRKETYGRPMSPEEVNQSQALAMNELKNTYQNNSLKQRYFAADNPFSLVGRMSAHMPSSFSELTSSGTNFLSSMVSSVGSALKNIVNTVGSFFLSSNSAYAAASSGTDYSALGVDEWGWTNDELNRAQTDPSFTWQSLANFVEPQLNELNSKYQKCYSYTLQVEKDQIENYNGDCVLGLASDEGLRWRAYMAKAYAADELSRDLEANEDLSQVGGAANGTCAPGTISLGEGEGFQGGNPVAIQLCAIPTLPSSSSESRPGTAYSIPNANGMAIVNADISGKVLDLVSAAKAAGLTLGADSAFRSNAHQQALYSQYTSGSGNIAAKPGFSNHQMGLAIDFNCDGKRFEGSPCFGWMVANAANFGFTNFKPEPWHWSTNGQ